ncbi:IS3 family transposase ISRosp2 [Roseobacter fucihabitans]|uniref:IS3 family transposase ISRosp2 n=1 Tax=Roseobacter fucihabitans TaxID=1537242 RepID=A0ABZ2BXI2_9RHOB|nr:hypothetical protein [Roseobacter litoralis]
MRQSCFTEARIIGMIKEQEAGMPTAEVCRRHGLSQCIVLQIQSKIRRHALHGRVSRSDVPRVNISDTHRLKSLEDKSAKLKRLLADTMLNNVMLKDLLGKN